MTKAFTVALVTLVLGIRLVSEAGAQACAVGLAEVGPVSADHGFPEYYVDTTGLALAPCLDFVCDPALALPNPSAPAHFPDNFPEEFFYSRAISDWTGPGSMTGRLVLALEGAFANGAVAAGDQVVFARIRVRLFNMVAGGTYTVTHPYGVETLQADATGFVNFTEDVGTVPGQFTLALGGRVGPFLTFLAGPIAPAPGTIGTSAAPQTVTGSACNQNFFKVEGPGLPAGGVTQNQFSTIIGRIAPICGNGTLDFGEDCDDGNTLAGDCCSPSCEFEPAGQACDDGNPCTINGTCDGAGVCSVTGFTTAPCDDGNVCTTGDVCSGGTCVGGPPPACPVGTVLADVAVVKSTPTTKLGKKTTILVDNSPIKRSFLRVQVTGIGARSVASALLRLKVANASVSGGSIHPVTSCGWDEAAMTWNTSPAIDGPAISTLGKVTAGKLVDFNVKNGIPGDGIFCFGMDSTSTDGADYNSREATSGKPQLLITASPACGCP